ncbi:MULTISPECIES: hypothetical protein [Pontibacillus]|uniref:Uncharacterized protein n=1 Tax=Pontibacillus chungwhensis TaxID=265426 RepID=A0ABY8UWK6_9BACI|nr:MULTISPECIES: hypothetical protein [Pontibacillus]MCD5324139.1 hypothetical protein [Pontibacillus sp. HN14]WIF97803.1 hypothetical protein QNI29_19080 [Pontibacillus chungwhensis]
MAMVEVVAKFMSETAKKLDFEEEIALLQNKHEKEKIYSEKYYDDLNNL